MNKYFAFSFLSIGLWPFLPCFALSSLSCDGNPLKVAELTSAPRIPQESSTTYFDLKDETIAEFSQQLDPLPILASSVVSKAQSLISQLTLAEKIQLLSGAGWWHTQGVPRLGIPALQMADGPHGLRITGEDPLSDSLPATAFPTASAMASSWDTDLNREVAQALGREATVAGVELLLGPGVNIKRSPLGGRNFEYYSEDPFLAGKMGAAFVDGLQSQNVGAVLKHLAGNNQETQRMSMNAQIDTRTLHEIYLTAFESIIRDAKPWAVMTSYNKLNGTYTYENALLLRGILRAEWGFAGITLSDWGAVDERLPALKAGLNLAMPGLNDVYNQQLTSAFSRGELTEAELNEAIFPIVDLASRRTRMAASQIGPKENQVAMRLRHHRLAEKAAAQSMVLLKNDSKILPFRFTNQKIAVIGALARTSRIQGEGSSKVHPLQQLGALTTLKKYFPQLQLNYQEGYSSDGESTHLQIQQAIQAASSSEAALLFVGLAMDAEGEGADRESMDLPAGTNKLIQAVLKVQPRTVVVLVTGSPVSVPWVTHAQTILLAGLAGQGMAPALVQVLSGIVNPSGKLAETWPVKLSDTPTAFHFPATDGTAVYREGIFVGYRHYDQAKIEPLFGFGHGLSYTDFRFGPLKLQELPLSAGVELEVPVTNVGLVSGSEVVQVYVEELNPLLPRPPQELKAFAKLELLPGQTKRARLLLNRLAFAHFDPLTGSWLVTPGDYKISVGDSSRRALVDLIFQAR